MHRGKRYNLKWSIERPFHVYKTTLYVAIKSKCNLQIGLQIFAIKFYSVRFRR